MSRRWSWIWIWSVSLGVAVRAASAQHPLCPPPGPEDTYYYSCRPGTQQLVGKFLYDLSVRHLLKSDDSFDVPLETLITVLDLAKFFDPTDPKLKEQLASRAAIQFKPVDRTTGEFTSVGAQGEQTISVANEKLGLALDLTIPAVVQGLYWRSPAHLELQFFKGHAIGFRVSGKNITEYQERLNCVSVTTSRVRSTTTDPTHRYLMSFFDRCP